jgi:hypothetical protein
MINVNNVCLMRFSVFFVILFLYSSIFASDNEWMKKQISEDLRPLQKVFCFKCMTKYYEQSKDIDLLCLFNIRNNNVQYKKTDVILENHERFFSFIRRYAHLRRDGTCLM